jgi:hypothetical protein
MIAICVPSRGLIFSKTTECIVGGMAELSKIGIGSIYVSSHDLTIPDCFNYCVETALQNQAVQKIFFLEEDMFVYPDAFVALATSDFPIATLQYNDKNGSPFGIIHYNEAQEILWCGFGATAIKREVFEKLDKPYFRSDVRYKIVKKQVPWGKAITDFQEIETRSDNQYGGHDVDFYTRVRKLGYKIENLSQFKAHHFKLVSLGEAYNNKGCHVIGQV